MNMLFDENFLKNDAHIKNTYGDAYPILWCDPEIDAKQGKALKDLIQENKSLHTFTSYLEALKFAKSLGISFLIIIPNTADEQKFYQEFSSLKLTFGIRMVKYEEEEVFKYLFNDDSEKAINTMKAYVFFTQSDYFHEAPVAKEEEEVTLMGDVNSMAKEFRQEFSIIFYDPNMSHETKEKLVEDLEIDIGEKSLYKDILELLKGVKDYGGAPYHLIMAGRDIEEKILNEIAELQDLLGLYIYCENNAFEKVVHEKIEKAKTLEELIPRIKQGIRMKSKLRNNFPAFTTNFDSWDRSHINYKHHYLQGFINFKNRKQAKEDFLKLARKIYQDENKVLSQFEEMYDKDKKVYEKEKKKSILYWYTKDSPIYKLINNCLRIASSDSILYCRFALKEMEEAIRDQYREKDKNFNGLVYRGAYISLEEWEKLQKNIGQEIEMSGFLSTTVSERVALNFLKGDPKNKIFIIILVPPLPEADGQGFADVSEFSEFKGEKEILFNVKSKFQILQAFTTKTQVRYCVLLFGAQLLRKYMTNHSPSVQIKLELPSKENIQCNICGNKRTLSGYQQVTTQFRCWDCLTKNPIPKDTPILILTGENTKNAKYIMEEFPGKILQFNQTGLRFPLSDYKCFDCQASGKQSYFRWITYDGKDIKQCSECFQKKKKIKTGILISETFPYTIWLERQKEWQMIETQYKTRFSDDYQFENEGEVYNEVQDFHRCIEYGKRVLKKLIFTRRRERKKMMIYKMLGIAYESQGNHQEAKNYFTNALNIGKLAWDSTTITLYNDLAEVYLSLGELDAAEANSLKALKLVDLLGNKEVLESSRAHNSLALRYERLGQHKQALEHFETNLGVKRLFLGENHLETATSWNNVAGVQKSLGMHKEAEDSFLKAFVIKNAILGENHPEIGLAYHNMGEMHLDLGEYKKSVEYFESSIKIVIPFYGEKHWQTAATYNSLGKAYSNLGKYQKALECHKKSLEIKISVRGESHGDAALSYEGLGTVYWRLNKFGIARDYQMKALGIQKSLYGEEAHPSIACLYTNLALINQDLGENEKALEFAIKSLDMTISIYGEVHRDTANSYNNLANVYEGFGNFSKVAEYYMKALHIYKCVLGEEHPETASVYLNLGCVQAHLGQNQKGKDNLKKAYNIRKKILGMDHPDTIESREVLVVANHRFRVKTT